MLLLGKQLYRSLLREARALPDTLVSEHYLAHIRASFRRHSVPEASVQAIRRVKGAQKLLRQLQAANDGYLHALTRAFETAYGLRGREKHRSLAPFLSTPTSASHTFPPPLAALVTSSLSHLSRPPTPSQLLTPPTLPERADPASEEARLLGPLTIQRESAVRRRWWNSQTGKIRAPVAIKVRRADGSLVDDAKEAADALKAAGLPVQSAPELEAGWARLAALNASAAASFAATPLPPRRLQTTEQRATSHPLPPPTREAAKTDEDRRQFKPRARDSKWHPPKAVTSRLLRRVRQGVGEKAVVVTLGLPPAMAVEAEAEKAAKKKKGGKAGAPKWGVSLAGCARTGRERYREATAEDLWWMEQAELAEKEAGKSKKVKKGE
ncbi:hypothetical protein JCM10213_001612 [Rhodosporidiobolus nylandii]